VIPIARPALGEREIGYLEDCIYSGRVATNGAFVELFEQRFAGWCGARHAVATTTGTAALHLALVALGVGKGDEVIVPALAYIAVANAVTYTGARPVFIDSNPDSWTIDPKAVADAINPRTKGIIAVHLYGHPADLDALKPIAQHHHLFLLEGAADALGATVHGTRVGTLATAGWFSFAPDKTITTGGGGMLVTDDEKLAVRARLLSMQGRVSQREYLHSWIGFTYGMTNLQAALGAAQMDEIDLRVGVRRDVGMRYRELLSATPGLRVGADVPWGGPCFGRVALLVGDAFPWSRGELQRRLRREGIETEPFYYPNHLQIPYMTKGRRKRLPVAEELYERGLLLPSSIYFANEELARVTGAIRRIAAGGERSRAAARRRERRGIA
jgi:perosamine synthetase